MRIAFAVVKNISRGGGIERYTEALGSRLVRHGHEVRVYSMHHHGPLTPWHDGMRILGTPCIPITACEKLSAGATAVLHASLSSWPDILHLHSVGPGAFGSFARLCKKPTVVQFHGIEWRRARWSRFGSNVLKALERITLQTCPHVTAVSKIQCEYLREKYGVFARHIPGGADRKDRPEPRELALLGLAPRRYVFFASRLVSEKGAHDLIAAFRRLKTDDKLVIAGESRGNDLYRRELQRQAAGDPRIVWPGFVQGRLLDELFAHARIYVQPSSLEGLSLALIEAMQFGTCCLVSDIPENLEAIGDGGMAFRQGDVADLAAKLAWLQAHPDAAARLDERASVRCRSLFSWDRVTEEFEGFYREILDGSRPNMRTAP